MTEQNVEQKNDVGLRNAIVMGVIALVLIAVLIWGGSFLINTFAQVQTAHQPVVIYETGNSGDYCTDTKIVDDRVVEGAVKIEEEAIKVVKYAEGYDSTGKFLPAGTVVKGYAMIKENPDKPHAIAVYANAEYTLEVDSVVWLYIANEKGFESEFVWWEKVYPIKP